MKDPRALNSDLRIPSAQRWGNRVLLSFVTPAPRARTRATVVQTEQFARPYAFALQWRFQTAVAGDPLTPNSGFGETTAVPLTIFIRRGLDALGGSTIEQFGPGAFLALPNFVMAHQLGIDVELIGPLAGDIFVEVLATPVGWIPDSALLGGTGSGYTTATTSRIAAAAVDTLLATADPTRRQFFIVNNSVQDLAVLFGSGVPSLAAGAENFSVLLPGGSFATYESPLGGYTGMIRGIWRAADAAGEALVTSGTP